MKLYHLVACLAAALAVYEIVCFDIEAEMKSTESVRSKLVQLEYRPALVEAYGKEE